MTFFSRLLAKKPLKIAVHNIVSYELGLMIKVIILMPTKMRDRQHRYDLFRWLEIGFRPPTNQKMWLDDSRSCPFDCAMTEWYVHFLHLQLRLKRIENILCTLKGCKSKIDVMIVIFELSNIFKFWMNALCQRICQQRSLLCAFGWHNRIKHSFTLLWF